MNLMRFAFVGLLVLAAAPASAKVKSFVALMNSGQEVPVLATDGLGVAYFTFDTATNMLCFASTHANLSAAEVDCHIHGGPLTPGASEGPGFDSPVMFPLPLGTSKQGCVGPLDPSQKTRLKKGLLYINIHTATNPGGEIRGQIVGTK